MDSAEDARRRQRVEHESEAVDKSQGSSAPTTTSTEPARSSPLSFLVWLEGHSPEAYAFELCAGSPCAT